MAVNLKYQHLGEYDSVQSDQDRDTEFDGAEPSHIYSGMMIMIGI